MAARQAGMSFSQLVVEFWNWRTNMSQAALNTRNSEKRFLLAAIMERVWRGSFSCYRFNDSVGERLGRVGLDGRCQRLPLSKLVLTGERHYTRNEISGSRSWHWVSQVPL